MTPAKSTAEPQVPDKLEASDLDTIHDEVQRILSRLDAPVMGSPSNPQVHPGRNSGKTWLLYSYRTFEPPAGTDIDPVVVGITLSRDGDAIIVRGDIAGETSGDVLFEAPAIGCIGKPALRDAAERVAERLTRQAEMVRAALADSLRRA